MRPTISRSFLAITVAFAVCVHATPLSTNPLDAPRQRYPFILAPVIEAEHPHGTINNSYIVVLRDDVSSSIMANHLNFLSHAHQNDASFAGDSDAGLRHVYDTLIKGYAGRFSQNVLDQVRSMPEVAYVERDQIVRTQDTQRGAPWGLARISHRPKLTFGTFQKYEHNPSGGQGVDVYVIDTGINIEHVEFEGRARWGRTVPINDVDEDQNGHGTHCAGTIASRKFGVAKAAAVIAVKVLGSNGSGSMSDVLSGVQWASQQAASKAATAAVEYAATGQATHKGSVANMSLGGGKSRALEDAVNRASDAGLHFVVAAGNDNRDACVSSPAGAEKAVTVAASTLADERAYFSNHGSCVDVFAPGLNILSTWTGSTTAVNTISGTSMASPHTAGLLAYLLSIYPSKEFNTDFSDNIVVPGVSVSQAILTSGSFSSIYALTHASLPPWISGFLPSPALVEVLAPVPLPPVLSPVQLKKAVLRLATRDVLVNLPDKTPNLLIFNNATADS